MESSSLAEIFYENVERELAIAKRSPSDAFVAVPQNEELWGRTVAQIRKLLDVISLPADKYHPSLNRVMWVGEDYVYQKGDDLIFFHI